MLRFESWPPQPGMVEFEPEALQLAESRYEYTRIIGHMTALLLASHTNPEAALQIIDELSESLDDRNLLTNGDLGMYRPGTPRTEFMIAALATASKATREEGVSNV